MKKIIFGSAWFFLVVAVVVAGAVYLMQSEFNDWAEQGELSIRNLKPEPVDFNDSRFPPLLRTYLHEVIQNPKAASYAEFKQTGVMALKKDGELSFFEARQTSSLLKPWFSWVASMKFMGLRFSVCDRIVDDKASLQARLYGAVRIADESGDELMQGELIRYLSEIPWLPLSIYMQPQIQWDQVSEKVLIATTGIAGVVATLQFHFGADGLISKVYAPLRARKVGDKMIDTPWEGRFRNYQLHDGMLIPTYGEVSWISPDGKFTYFQGKIVDYKLVE